MFCAKVLDGGIGREEGRHPRNVHLHHCTAGDRIARERTKVTRSKHRARGQEYDDKILHRAADEYPPPRLPVLRPNVGPLAVLGGGIVHLEEDFQQVGRRDLGRVVLHLNRLGVASLARANLEGHERRGGAR